MATIYLSSTYEDLKDYRRVVYEALRKSGHEVKAMEDYVAADQRPVDQCLKDVEIADIYVGLFAFRYGYAPPPEHNNPMGLSITELEYRHAESLKKPCLTFLVNDSTAWPRVFDDAYSAEDKGHRIKTLREHLLRERLASQFSGPHELSAVVLAAVTKYLAEHRQPDPVKNRESGSPAAITWDIDAQGSPYPGLMHFTRKYAPVFFGRDAEVREVLDRLRKPDGRFIIVSGDSGTGKSSVIHAGVLPKIEQEGLPDNKHALCVRMLPSQERDPFAALVRALSPVATEAGLNPDDLVEELVQAPALLGRYIQTILAKGTKCDTLVLFLDQMEELFTAHTPRASREFLQALFNATQQSPLCVLATIRSDHLHHCHNHPQMLEVLRSSGHYPLGPIEPFMLEDLIAKPARCAGLAINNKLVRRIADESLIKAGDLTKPDKSNLPLLAFVLHELYERRSNRELSEDAYNRIGGVAGAVAKHAAVVEDQLRRTKGVKADVLFLPQLFDSLIIVNQLGLPTRRRPLAAELPAELRGVVEVLVQKRLLRTEDEGEKATVSISHETLFEAWPSLKSYLDKNRKQLIDRTLLESRAKKWKEEGRSWHSGLASAREDRDYSRGGIIPTDETKDYLQASRRARRAFKGAIAIVAFLLLGTTWLWQKGYDLAQAYLKVQSMFVSIHLEPEMQVLAAGSFRQGDIHGLGDSDERPAHEVRIRSFAIGKFEVTFEEYDRFAIATGRSLPGDQNWGRGRRPVINVSWQDAQDYAEWLSRQTKKQYRLPTESEWEYAARSEGKNDIWAGTSDKEQLKIYAAYAVNSQSRTAPIGTDQGREPNAIKLYDMSGNVWEWVKDCVHDNYSEAPNDGSAWLEMNGGNCQGRMIRGGSWFDLPDNLRLSYRNWYFAIYPYGSIGFRLAQDIEP
ncbi:MAG: SUMF1/EgtB/PvdO family nonheme iron enzyme [Nitrospira sp.]